MPGHAKTTVGGYRQVLNSIGSFLILMLSKLIPKRFKRFILLTTIYSKGVEEKLFTKKDLEGLNNKLCIADNVTAMENLSMVTGRFWSGPELSEIVRQAVHCRLDGECVPYHNADDIGRQILETIPSWLRYDQTDMLRDIVSLFRVEKIRVV